MPDSRMAMPADAAAMKSHLMADPPAGHGMDAVDMPMANMEAKHNAMHNSGAEHDHPGMSMSKARPPKDDLVRASTFELRSASESDAEQPPTMFGYFTPFNAWSEIDSAFEGHFMERTAPGAFTKTIAENRNQIKALFQHGEDPQIGDKPLGPITVLREEDFGPYYEVPLLDAAYVRDDILPGLQAGLYGASYRFQVVRDDWIDKPKRSDSNPAGIPERTIKESRLFEFGPVTFPAFPTASAGVRSLTDAYILDRFRAKPELVRELIEALPVEAPSVDAEPPAHLEGTPRKPVVTNPRFRSRQEYLKWLTQP